MNPWLETLGAALLAVAGAALGRWFARQPKWYWSLGYGLGFLLLLGIGLPNWFNALFFTPPFSWLTAGRTEYALAGFITTLLLTTPLSRVPAARLRVLVVMFMVLVVLVPSVLSFLGPALIRSYLAGLKTKVNQDGICLQGNNYNCGPASAVTALRRLQLPAEEGQLAIWAHTSPITGTPPDVLADTLRKHYGRLGLTAEYRYFKTLGEMKGVGEILAVIKYAFLVDHYVAILEVTDQQVVVGDPLVGKVSYAPDNFKKIWRFSGVVLQRK